MSPTPPFFNRSLLCVRQKDGSFICNELWQLVLTPQVWMNRWPLVVSSLSLKPPGTGSFCTSLLHRESALGSFVLGQCFSETSYTWWPYSLCCRVIVFWSKEVKSSMMTSHSMQTYTWKMGWSSKCNRLCTNVVLACICSVYKYWLRFTHVASSFNVFHSWPT